MSSGPQTGMTQASMSRPTTAQADLRQRYPLSATTRNSGSYRAHRFVFTPYEYIIFGCPNIVDVSLFPF